MEVIYALVPLLGGWLVYGLIASLFLKRASSRDYLLLISSGLVGGLIGGSIGNNMDIPQNLWWMREIIKIGVSIVAMYTIQIIRFQIYNFRNNVIIIKKLFNKIVTYFENFSSLRQWSNNNNNDA